MNDLKPTKEQYERLNSILKSIKHNQCIVSNPNTKIHGEADDELMSEIIRKSVNVLKNPTSDESVKFLSKDMVFVGVNNESNV